MLVFGHVNKANGLLSPGASKDVAQGICSVYHAFLSFPLSYSQIIKYSCDQWSQYFTVLDIRMIPLYQWCTSGVYPEIFLDFYRPSKSKFSMQVHKNWSFTEEKKELPCTHRNNHLSMNAMLTEKKKKPLTKFLILNEYISLPVIAHGSSSGMQDIFKRLDPRTSRSSIMQATLSTIYKSTSLSIKLS